MTSSEWLVSTDVSAMLAGLSGVGTPLWHAVAHVTPGGVPRGWPVSDRKLRLWTSACRAIAAPGQRWSELVDLETQVADWSRSGPSWVKECPMGVRAALLRMIVGNVFSPLVLPREEKRCGRCKKVPWTTQTVEHTNLGWLGCSHCFGRGVVAGECPWLTSLVKSLAEAAYESRLAVCSQCNGPLIQSQNHESRLYCVRCRVYPAMPATNGRLDPDRLAVLADACEEAGCCDPAFIKPLRGFRICPCNGKLIRGVDDAKHVGTVTRCLACVNGWLQDETPRFRGWYVTDILLGKE